MIPSNCDQILNFLIVLGKASIKFNAEKCNVSLLRSNEADVVQTSFIVTGDVLQLSSWLLDIFS